MELEAAKDNKWFKQREDELDLVEYEDLIIEKGTNNDDESIIFFLIYIKTFRFK